MSLLCVGCAASQAVNIPSIGLHSPDMSPLASHLPSPHAAFLAPALPEPTRVRLERITRPPDNDADYAAPSPPPGYGIMSVPIDSACTVHCLKDDRWFKWLRPTRISIQTANDATEVAQQQGAAILHCHSTTGKHTPSMLHDAVHVPQMHMVV